MRKALIATTLLLSSLSLALPASASSLSNAQIQALEGLLSSFNVPQATIATVDHILRGLPVTAVGGTTGGGGSGYVFTHALDVGSQGTDVTELQTLLKAQGYFTYPTATGYFGPATAAAVAAFQKAHHIEAIGGVGPLTRNLLNQLESQQGSTVSNPSTSSGQAANTPTQTVPSTPASGGGGGTPTTIQNYTPPAASGGGGGGSSSASGGSSSGSASSGSSSSSSGSGTPVPVADTTPPSVTVTAPTINLAAGTTQTSLSAATNEAASCRYSTTASFTFSSGTLFATTGNTSHSTTISGLTNGSTHTYYVKCQDSAGNTSGNASVTFTVAAPDSTAPTAPTNVVATAVSSSQISLTWTASTDAVGVTGYQVFRGGVQIATPSTTSYSDTGLTASTSYSYTVKAADAAGNVSASSTAVSATTGAASVGGGGGGVTGVIDAFPGATVAISTTKENSAYAGPALRVRRASDSTEQDIPFSGKDASVAAFNSFCGGTTCYLKTFYDQSGNANNCVQTTASRQWQVIVDTDGKLTPHATNNKQGCQIADSATYKTAKVEGFTVLRGDNDTSTHDSIIYGYMPTGSVTTYGAQDNARFALGWSLYDYIFAASTRNAVGSTWTPSRMAYIRAQTNDFTVWDWSSQDQQLRIGSGFVVMPSDGTVTNVTYPSAQVLMVGNNRGYTEGFTGSIRALILYGATQANRDNISSYLNSSADFNNNPIPFTFVKDGFTFDAQTNAIPGWGQTGILDTNGIGWGHEFGGYDWSFGHAQTTNNTELVRFEVRPNDSDTLVTQAERAERGGSLNGSDISKGGNFDTFAQFKIEPGQLQNGDWALTFQIHYGDGSQPDLFFLNLKNDQFQVTTQSNVANGDFTGPLIPFTRNVWYAMRVTGHWSTNGTSDTLQVWLGPNGGPLTQVVNASGKLFATDSTSAYVKEGIYRGYPGANAGNLAIQVANHKYSLTSGTFASYVSSQPPLPSNGSTSDTTVPSTPTGLTATTISSSAVNLAWTASTDNVGVSGYKIYRGGVQVGTSGSTSYSDMGLNASTNYSYTVAAYDAAGNSSAQSSSASATTQASGTPVDTTPPVVTITAPSGQLAANTTQTTLSVTTDESATCAWSNTAGAAFASMTPFTTTGGTTHSSTISSLVNGSSYTTYVKCKDTAGNISTDSPVAYSVASAGGGGSTTVTMGETTVLPSTDTGNGNLLIVQDATLSQAATIQSLSFNVVSAAGQLVLGVYDATGAGGGPGSLKATTNAFTPVAGWNTQNVITPVSLPAGNYWLAYLPSSSSLSFATNFSIGTFHTANFTFGAMPATFPTIVQNGTTHWSLYGTLTQ